jgi:hypothetical protein
LIVNILRLHFSDSKHLSGFVCHEIFGIFFPHSGFFGLHPQLYMLATALMQRLLRSGYHLFYLFRCLKQPWNCPFAAQTESETYVYISRTTSISRWSVLLSAVDRLFFTPICLGIHVLISHDIYHHHLSLVTVKKSILPSKEKITSIKFPYQILSKQHRLFPVATVSWPYRTKSLS